MYLITLQVYLLQIDTSGYAKHRTSGKNIIITALSQLLENNILNF